MRDALGFKINYDRMLNSAVKLFTETDNRMLIIVGQNVDLPKNECEKLNSMVCGTYLQILYFTHLSMLKLSI